MKRIALNFILPILAMVCTATIFGACSSKENKEEKSQTPIEVIESIGKEAMADGDKWEEDDWNKKADELKAALDSLPSPLETQEEITVKSALTHISVKASKHERKAAKMMAVIEEYEKKTNKNTLDGTHTLTGVVHTYPITMTITVDGDNVEGTYYYDRKGPDAKLKLVGTNHDGELDINETTEDGMPTGHFVGHFADGIFKGTFISTQGKRLAFAVGEEGADRSNVTVDDIDVNASEYDGGSSDSSFSTGDSSIDEALDHYERYMNNYISLVKKMGNNDPTAVVEISELYSEIEDLSNKLENAKGEMSTAQMQRLQNITIKIAKAAESMR